MTPFAIALLSRAKGAFAQNPIVGSLGWPRMLLPFVPEIWSYRCLRQGPITPPYQTIRFHVLGDFRFDVTTGQAIYSDRMARSAVRTDEHNLRDIGP